MALVRAGRIIKVANKLKPKFSNQNDFYLSVWVEDEDGKNERCLLFTPREIKFAELRAKKNIEDLTTKGPIQNLID